MRKVTVTGLLARKLRLALTALAIVLGVTFVTGTLVLTDTLSHTFTTLVSGAYQHVSFEIRGKAEFNSNTAAAEEAPPAVSPFLSRLPRRLAGCLEPRMSPGP